MDVDGFSTYLQRGQAFCQLKQTSHHGFTLRSASLKSYWLLQKD